MRDMPRSIALLLKAVLCLVSALPAIACTTIASLVYVPAMDHEPGAMQLFSFLVAFLYASAIVRRICLTVPSSPRGQ